MMQDLEFIGYAENQNWYSKNCTRLQSYDRRKSSKIILPFPRKRIPDLAGHQKLVEEVTRLPMAILGQALRDLLSTNKAIREDAADWIGAGWGDAKVNSHTLKFDINAIRRLNNEAELSFLSFDDCVEMLNLRFESKGSDIHIDADYFRMRCMQAPEAILSGGICAEMESDGSGIPTHYVGLSTTTEFEARAA